MRRVLACAVLLLSAALAPFALDTAHAETPYTITTHPSTRTPVLNFDHKVVFLGRVSPRADGDYMVLQQRGSKTARWHNERRTRIDARGRFRLADLPTTLHPRWYRVIKLATRGHAQVATRAWLVRPHRWRHLADLPGRVRGDVNLRWPVRRTYDHVTYRRAFTTRRPDQNARVAFVLDRRCQSVKLWLGLETGSPEGSEVAATVLGGGRVLRRAALLPEIPIGLGFGSQGVDRLRLRLTHPDGAADADVVVRRAEVLCTF